MGNIAVQATTQDLHTCTLRLGDGSTLEFVDGRATATEAQAEMLKDRTDLVFGDAAAAAPESGNSRVLPYELQQATDEELVALARILAAIQALGENVRDLADALERNEPARDDDQGGAPADEPPHPPPAEPTGEGNTENPPTDDSGDPTAPAPEDATPDAAHEAAAQMLREEGEHVPHKLPEGFEAKTAEGEPRCYARKGDGEQCKNAAHLDGDGNSTDHCQLPAHKTQVAALPS